MKAFVKSLPTTAQALFMGSFHLFLILSKYKKPKQILVEFMICLSSFQCAFFGAKRHRGVGSGLTGIRACKARAQGATLREGASRVRRYKKVDNILKE